MMHAAFGLAMTFKQEGKVTTDRYIATKYRKIDNMIISTENYLK